MSGEIKNLKEYINFPNTTSTFKKLIGKYHMKKKDSEKHNRKLLLKKIEAKIQELENDEKESDFILGEVRRNAQINKEILYSFGTKALNHLDKIKHLRITSKIDRSKFFEIDNESVNVRLNESNNTRDNKSVNINRNRNRLILLPKINKTRNNRNYDNSFTINKISEYSIDNKSVNQRKNSNSLHLMTPKKQPTTQNMSLFYVKSSPVTNSSPATNRDTNEAKSKESIDTNKKKRIVIDSDYLDYIQKMKNKFIETEKRQERYFFNHKYGYDNFKLKYNFLKNKYFN
jgi:hypothetical protein